MTDLTLTLVVRDYDVLAPLAAGDVETEGIGLTLVRDRRAIELTRDDPSIQAGELSFSRQLIRQATGDRSWVALPIMVMQSFRHRCFFVRRDSGLRALEDLAGKRVGTDDWPATGNTWSRAALRDRGVPLDTIRWYVGPVDGPSSGMVGDPLPPHAQPSPAGRSLHEMLLAGDLDALMCPHPPRGFHAPNSPVVRLLADYHAVEREYFHRTGIFPVVHIIGMRRELFERAPWAAMSLYRALDRSKDVWLEARRRLSDTTPWLIEEIEETTALIGPDWRPNGVEANRAAIDALCQEELAQGLIAQPLDPTRVFAEFEQAYRG